MSDIEQYAIVTLIDARDTTLTQAWTGRDEDNGIDFPLCADRTTAQQYAEDRWRRYSAYEDEINDPLTWATGPARAEHDDGATRHQVSHLQADGCDTNISIYALAVHPDLASALADTGPQPGVTVVEHDWDTLLGDGEEG